ncbi:hypothetical protein Mhar_0166 [Methanothrix harundinacea 6Ac]|uniref:Uncharacterized protein n=1 Tax=Methanothrix harundinacea (strain 6Ac) TaxID=1110509 RepID=G7WL03_METH6|nr:hypothetical protein Mhar_0166 [Methanothrix harundinacea 6Ac]
MTVASLEFTPGIWEMAAAGEVELVEADLGGRGRTSSGAPSSRSPPPATPSSMPGWRRRHPLWGSW